MLILAPDVYTCEPLTPGKSVSGQAPRNATLRAVKVLRRELGLTLKCLAVLCLLLAYMASS